MLKTDRRVQGFGRRESAISMPRIVPSKSLPREGKFENEGWRVRKDGSRFWAYVIIDPIRDDTGKLVDLPKLRAI